MEITEGTLYKTKGSKYVYIVEEIYESVGIMMVSYSELRKGGKKKLYATLEGFRSNFYQYTCGFKG